jgi:hypothetical protein
VPPAAGGDTRTATYRITGVNKANNGSARTHIQTRKKRLTTALAVGRVALLQRRNDRFELLC